MRNIVTVVVLGAMVVVAVGSLSAQIAGSTTTGVTVEGHCQLVPCQHDHQAGRSTFPSPMALTLR